MREKDPEKINKIFEATLKLANEEGIDAINMAKIAKEAKVASGTLYIYFENKETLLNELYTYACDLWIESVDISIESNDFREKLYIIWKNNIDFALDNFEVMKFKILFLHSKYLNQTNREKSSSLLDSFYKLFDEAKENKIIKDMNSELIYSLLESSMFQVINYLKETGKMDKKAIDDSFLFCWHGIRN